MLLTLLIVLASPMASASCLNNGPTGGSTCQGINDTIVGGFQFFIEEITLGIAYIGHGIFIGVIDFVVTPFLGIWGDLFGGIGQSLGEGASGFFNGARDAFRSAYQQLAGSLRFFGPLAPIVTAGVVVVIIVMLIFMTSFIVRILARAFRKDVDTIEEP
jgi:hypothetical protein